MHPNKKSPLNIYLLQQLTYLKITYRKETRHPKFEWLESYLGYHKYKMFNRGIIIGEWFLFISLSFQAKRLDRGTPENAISWFSALLCLSVKLPLRLWIQNKHYMHGFLYALGLTT